MLRSSSSPTLASRGRTTRRPITIIVDIARHMKLATDVIVDIRDSADLNSISRGCRTTCESMAQAMVAPRLAVQYLRNGIVICTRPLDTDQDALCAREVSVAMRSTIQAPSCIAGNVRSTTPLDTASRNAGRAKWN